MSTVAIILVTLIYWNRKLLYRLSRTIISSFNHYDLGMKLQKKLKLLGKCSRRGLQLAATAMTLSLLGELVLVYMQWSIILSWIIPSYLTTLRSYLFFGGISFSLHPQLLANLVAGSSSGESAGLGGSPPGGSWGIDIGSMIALALYKWLVSQLDNYAARSFQPFRKDKSSSSSTVEKSNDTSSGLNGQDGNHPPDQSKWTSWVDIDDDIDGLMEAKRKFFGASSASQSTKVDSPPPVDHPVVEGEVIADEDWSEAKNPYNADYYRSYLENRKKPNSHETEKTSVPFL